MKKVPPMTTTIKAVLEQCREYNIAGGVLAYLLTCRPIYLPGLQLRLALERELGIPSVLIECDLVDERSFSEAQIKTRMDAFAEQILKKLESGEPMQNRKAVA